MTYVFFPRLFLELPWVLRNYVMRENSLSRRLDSTDSLFLILCMAIWGVISVAIVVISLHSSATNCYGARVTRPQPDRSPSCVGNPKVVSFRVGVVKKPPHKPEDCGGNQECKGWPLKSLQYWVFQPSSNWRAEKKRSAVTKEQNKCIDTHEQKWWWIGLASWPDVCAVFILGLLRG